MKEKLVTVAIVILLIICLFLIIGCGADKDILVLPGHYHAYPANYLS